MDNSVGIRLECLKLAVQVATAEALQESKRAPTCERVAEVTNQFYNLVIQASSETPAEVGVPSVASATSSAKKVALDKDPVFR